MEVHSTHTYIGKGLGLVYRNTTNQGDPCPLHKKPRGKGGGHTGQHATKPQGPTEPIHKRSNTPPQSNRRGHERLDDLNSVKTEEGSPLVKMSAYCEAVGT